MKMLMHVILPIEPFNSLQRAGRVGQMMQKIIEDTKPESVYFTEHDGNRGATMVINVNKESDIPFYAEPWFLQFEANCEFRIMMTPSDLQNANLDELASKWG